MTARSLLTAATVVTAVLPRPRSVAQSAATGVRGGNGGTVTLDSKKGSIEVGYCADIKTDGGNGGNGGKATAECGDAIGGDGGNGGNGGKGTLTAKCDITDDGKIVADGGNGGNGGKAKTDFGYAGGGDGGNGGNGGTVKLSADNICFDGT